VAQRYLTCVCNVILLLNELALILTLSCGLWVSVRVTGVPIPAISAGYEPLCGLRASLRVTSLSTVTGVSAGYGRLCGRRASLRVTGVSAGYGRVCARRASIRVAGIALCGLRTSLRATDVSARDELLYAWLASLSTDYSCGSASTVTLTRASTGGWPRSLYVPQLRICQYRNSDARLYGWLASLSLRTTVADLPVPQIWRASSSLQLIVGACLSRCLPCLQCSVLLCLFC
jgi:hypothetical protein